FGVAAESDSLDTQIVDAGFLEVREFGSECCASRAECAAGFTQNIGFSAEGFESRFHFRELRAQLRGLFGELRDFSQSLLTDGGKALAIGGKLLIDLGHALRKLGIHAVDAREG